MVEIVVSVLVYWPRYLVAIEVFESIKGDASEPAILAGVWGVVRGRLDRRYKNDRFRGSFDIFRRNGAVVNNLLPTSTPNETLFPFTTAYNTHKRELTIRED